MSDNIRIQDDLYYHVNGEWIENAVIPADRPVTGGFSLLDQDVEKLLMSDFAKFASGEKKTDVPGMEYAIRLYKKVLDQKRRDEEGIKPLLPLLNKILGMKSIADFNAVLPELFMEGASLPFVCAVADDMGDATKHSAIILGPRTILPDTSLYAEGNPSGPQMLQLYQMMAQAILGFAPLSDEEKAKILQDTLAFDALIAKKVKSQLEWADYVKCHNPTPLDEVADSMKPMDLKGLVNALFGKEAPDTLVVYDPRAIKEFNGYFSEETFPLFVSWCYLSTLLEHSKFLSVPMAETSGMFRRALMGVAKEPELEKQAFQAASNYYDQAVGVYYGREYFGEEAKKDIVSLVHRIIDTYKIRVKKNSFLNEKTKEKAILKLSTIEVKMGYPDQVEEHIANLALTEEDSYYAASRKIASTKIRENLEKLNKPVDRTLWAMPGHMVNACYNPTSNDITFPAAILQKPFYSIHQSVEENLGGIGAVIGHEISHAFDNNGAQFDEKGNLNNWWTEQDYAAFQELTERMVEQWDGLEISGGKVNGRLVVSENIADNGGVAVTLEIMHTLDHPDFQKYFINWAKIWCQKAKEEYVQLLLVRDVHSPAPLRANIPPRNFPEWYEAFGVTAADKMYLPEDKRITIW